MYKIFTIIFLLLSFLSNAQNLTFYGLYPGINHTSKINNKLSYNTLVTSTFDTFDRKINGVEYPASDLQFYLHSGFIFAATKKLNLNLTYLYQRANPLKNSFNIENRIWQQATYTEKVANGNLYNRIRFEERFLHNRTTHKNPLATRFRHQIGFNRPMKKNSAYYYNTFNELFFSLTGTKNATLSGAWTYAGIGKKFSPKSRLEIGYLLQTSVRNIQHNLLYLQLMQFTWHTNF